MQPGQKHTGSRNKTLLTLIAVLLVANVGMLLFYLLRDPDCPEAPRGPGFTEKIRNEVGFSEGQMTQFEARKKQHWDSLRKRFDSIRLTKMEFFNLLYEPALPDSVVQVKAAQIGRQQEAIDLQVLQYFRDVRAMCTAEQIPRFDSAVPSVIQWMIDRPRR